MVLMYQALYRKYRPSNFDEVVGQDVIIQTLKNEILHNKLNHAYLFTGPRGTGKTSVAKILAKTVNCTNLNGFLPCNECVSCTQINNKQSTDIIEIDAASNNGVDEIRELKSKVNLVPSNSKYKIYIIDEVHMLTVGAFNALLKTLEEPPAHIIFILATTDPHKIPSTILSRCQRFDFKRISNSKIVERLDYIAKEEKIDITEEALYEIARLSDGGMRDSISMLDQVLSYSDEHVTLEDIHEVNGTLSQQDIKDFIEDILNKNIESLFNRLDEYNNRGKNFVKLTEEIILFLRNLLLYETVPNYFKDIKQNVEPYRNFHGKIRTTDLLNFISLFNTSINEMKLSNNPKMILELLIIRLFDHLNETKPIVKNEEKPLEKVENVSPSNTQLENPKEEKTEIKQIPKIVISHNKNANHNQKYFPGKVLKKEKKEEFNKIMMNRINNALAGFSRKELMEFKKKEELLHTYLLNPEYSKFVSMLFDGTLKALGNHVLIYVFPNERLSNLFNESILNIDAILKQALKEEYHAVATEVESWNQIKEEFNSKKKLYTYQEENVDMESFFEEQKEESTNALESLFGDIVEYQ